MRSPAQISRTSRLQHFGMAIVVLTVLYTQVELLAQSEPSGENVKKAEAQNLLAEAKNLFGQKTSATSQRALQQFRQSAELFAQIGDKRSQAESLVYVGMILENAEQTTEAISAYESAISLARSVDFNLAEAYALGGLGTIYSNVGEYQKAVEYLMRAVPLLNSIGDKGSEASTHALLGLIFQSQGSVSKAIESYSAAVALYHEVGNKNREASLFNSIGMVYANSGDQKKASEYFLLALPIARSISDRQLEALVSSNLGVSYQVLGQNPKALEILIIASAIFRELGDKKQETLSISSVGLLQLELSQNEKALEAFNRALELSRIIGDKNEEGKALFNIGGVSENSGDLRRAILFYEQGLTLFREAGAEFEQAIALASIGFTSASLGEREKALGYYNQALELHRKVKNKSGEALTLNNIGSIYNEIGQLPKSLEYRYEALKIYQSLDDRLAQANLYLSIGQSLENAGDRNGAFDYYYKALPIFRDLRDGKREAQALAQIALIYKIRGETSRAESLFNESRSACRSTGDRICETYLLGALGIFHNSSGEFEKAKVAFNQALETCPVSDKMCLIVTQVGLGQAYKNLSNYESSMKSFESAIALSRSIGLSSGEIAGLNSLGNLYSYLGLNQKAMDMFRAALKLSESTGAKDSEAVSLGNIGMAYFVLEEYEKALDFQKRALAIAEKTQDRNIEATQSNNIGLTYVEMKKAGESLEYFKRSVALSKMNGNRPMEAVNLLNLGYAYSELSQNGQALTSLNEALRLSRVLGDANTEAETLGTIALSWYQQKNLNLAAFYGKQALNIIQSLRTKLSGFDLETQKAFITKYEKSYRKLANIFVEMGRFADAEKVLSMLKEEEYFEYLRRDDKVANELTSKIALTPDEQKAFDEYKKYADSLTALGKEYGELQSESKRYEIGQFPKQKRLDELDKLLADANKVLSTFLDDLKVRFGENDKRVGSLESGSQAFLKEINQPNTVMISTIAGEGRLNIIVTTADAQRAHTVDIKNADLNKLVFDFRADVKNPRVDPRYLGKKIFDVLFPVSLQKDLEGVKADTIVWSLDGTLRYVPIAALWDGQGYLVEKYKNVLITLASRDKLASNSADRAKWLALGVGVSKQATVKGPDGALQSFEALSSVPEELCGLIDDPDAKLRCSTVNNGKVGVVTGKSLLDEQFTLQSFKSSLGRFPVVHIASHFSLNTGNENDSYLLLGGGDNRKLTLADVRQGGAKFTGVELLTLSACNTAMSTGNRSNGVEVEGFGALAQNQGARSVVASLWPVADTSTRDLMIEFYKRLAQTPLINKAEAMRLAQLSLLNGNYSVGETPNGRAPTVAVDGATKTFKADTKAPFAHPYYWSPFVLMGNWQ